MAEKLAIETDMCCAYCKQNKWVVSAIRDQQDKRTYLMLSCASPGCEEKHREILKATEADTIYWMSFDITGQGYDEITVTDSSLLN